MKGLFSHPVRRPAAAPPPDAKPRGVEVQIHPANIRSRVRYLFFTRRQVVLGALALTLFIGFLAFSFSRTPAVVRGLLQERELAALLDEREQQGERLTALNERLVALQEASREERLEMEKILLAYGLPDDVSIGQGGYPFATEAPPAATVASAAAFGDAVTHGFELRAQVAERLNVLEAFLTEVQELEAAFSDQASTTPAIKPMPAGSFVLTSPFGERVSPFTERREFHSGIDLAGLAGAPIHATGDAVVVFAGTYPKRRSVSWWHYGKLVVLRHGDSFITLYGHCSEVLVSQGENVKRGQLIAKVGSTGWSTNPHLHYEVRRKEEDGQYRPVDPRIYILDHRWADQERLLIRARRAPPVTDYEPLPRVMTR